MKYQKQNDMELLLKKLRNHEYESTALNFNGSPVYEVPYGDADEKLIFWNDSNSCAFDKDEACDLIEEMIADEGLSIMNNSVDVNWNTISFEIHDNNY